MSGERPDDPRRSVDAGLARGFVWLGLALAPTLTAIAVTPGFTTQDGPAHVYSARILNAALAGEATFASSFRVTWEPLPNWAGHLATMLALVVAPPEIANRVLTAATLASFAAAILTLRWVVAGPGGMGAAAVLAALLALNVTWLLGFTSFLIGATLYPATLAFWWSRRQSLTSRQVVGLGGLLILGYFAHPVSLGLTVASLGGLIAASPGPERGMRARRTMLGASPLLPLGLVYWSLTRSGGGLAPTWDHLRPTPRGLVSQLGWIDPLSLAAKVATPFDLGAGPIPGILTAPAPWIAAALILLAAASRRDRPRDRSGWLALGGALVGAALIAPDTIGAKHGHYLPQRIALLGLVALVPWFDLAGTRVASRAARSLLVLALVIQSAFVWDYAGACRERVTPFLRVADRFPAGTRAGTLLNSIRGKFRANPLLHADCLVAAATDAVFWTNYETAQYYFPVKARAGLGQPAATAFEEVALLDERRARDRRGQLWAAILDRHGDRIDEIIEWGADPHLDAMTGRDYEATARKGQIRVWTRRSR